MEAKRLKSIDEALHLLDDAAADGAKEIRSLIRRDYHQLRDAFMELSEEVPSRISELRDKAAKELYRLKDTVTERSQEVASKLDDNAHENPWTYVGVISLCATITGFILGRRLFSKD
jgi:ElaB/YqjD/DUF883 family membrane-anchored ribosome-binding protein